MELAQDRVQCWMVCIGGDETFGSATRELVISLEKQVIEVTASGIH
jgi:hypothetical protein